MSMQNYDALYDERRQRIEAALNALAFSQPKPPLPALLAESMRYSLLAGGKRMRAVLLLSSAEAFGDGGGDMALSLSCALEMIHAYSLIHDDLPCMDDDDTRRGKPTNHIVYGEGQATLAGDGLLTFAFAHMLKSAICHGDKTRAVSAMLEIASGSMEMVEGQCIDLLFERSENRADRHEALSYIQQKKTAALIAAPMRAGAIIAGADGESIEAAGKYGFHLGLSFQIIDDILDLEGDASALGKPTQSDERSGKLTYPAIYGIKRARIDAKTHADAAIAAIEKYPRAEFLRELATRQITRKN